MRISDLKLLIELSHSKSITLTAENMHISQQGLSQMITRLEQELNVILFRRSRHGITLTEAGQKTVLTAKEIVAKYDGLRAELELLSRQKNSPVEGDLTLFHSHNSGTTVLPKALKLFKARYPNVNLTLKESSPIETIARIKDDPAVVGLINFPAAYYLDPEKRILYSCPDLAYKELLRDDLIVCVPKIWSLSKEQINSAQELVKRSMVCFDTEQYAEIISLIFQEINQSPKVFLKTLNNELFRQTIIDGLAMGLVSTLELSDCRSLKECTLQSELRLKLVFTWVSSANYSMSIPAQKFLECLELSVNTSNE
ncbi:LysR family transcriptional regulator [Desulfosporosinus sp. PR]|uniref:LysR family transcriptional regulator n=1 Tax=Candidatus Desulfosporosinus nitrosoreducens TaxID=3401928 RepID=UPI0027F67939|nr:LysR family transcriptional regulator [Desulfosporosinus sp. PR]MDQ7094577.1 LysR family transcriptional regulator [Desulfosporosinus sp. PR]